MTGETLHSLRPKLTEAQKLQAQFVGHVTDAHRAARKQVKTHPIDDVEPGIPADRDDGIFVEAEPRENGGYRVHVTIADVAAHVKLGSHLARAATDRGATLYRPGRNDPVFPDILEERMSLEHEKERLGMTVTIDLDENYCPVHTEWNPTITHAENVSYEQVKGRAENDPQFALMDQIATGVRQNYFGKNKSSRLLQELLSPQTPYEAQPKKYRKSMEMVATYMLLTNSCIADFFDRSELPFMYRNFNEDEGDMHAGYSAEAKRHTALEKMGLKGAYCHFTSPIRRAPDFLDGHMAHFVHNSLKELEAMIVARHGDIDKEKLHKAIWDNGSEIMRLAAGMKNGNAMRYKAELEKILSGFIGELTGEGPQVLKAEVQRHADYMATLKSPLTSEALQGYAEHFNLLSQSPEQRAANRENEKHRDGNDKLDGLRKEDVVNLDQVQFSSLLKSAALTSKMPRVLYNEAIKRISENRIDRVQDGFSILIAAAHPKIPRWNMLKRAMSRQIKHDPGTVNTICDKLIAYLAPDEVKESYTSFPDKSRKLGPAGHPELIHGAIITWNSPDSGPVSPRYYSVGHNFRAATSHARFSFIESFAFSELQSVDQIAVPNLLYAELVDEKKYSKREVAEQLVQELQAELSVHTEETEEGFKTVVTVDGGALDEAIKVDAVEATAKQSELVALRRLLRDPTFKHTVSTAENMGHMFNPQHVLDEIITKKGGTLEVPRPKPTGRSGFLAEVKITTPEGTKVFEGHGPNMDRAIRTACVAALTTLDWSVDAPEQVGSWVIDVVKGPREMRLDVPSK